MAKNYRAHEQRFINEDGKTTRLVYIPQVKFSDGWCSFPDETTSSGVIEHKDRKIALANAKELYDHYHAKGAC